MRDAPPVFIDTNVIAHCRPLAALGWGWLGIGDVIDVYVVPQVLREADGLKHKTRGQTQKRVKQFMARLEEESSQHGMWRIEAQDAQINVRFSGVTTVDWLQTRDLDSTLPDDRVIAEIRVAAQGRTAILICADQALRMRSAAYGLVARRPPEEWEAPDEPDATEVALRKEVAELRRQAETNPRLTVLLSRAEGPVSTVEIDALAVPSLSDYQIECAVSALAKDPDSFFKRASGEGKGQWATDEETWRREATKAIASFPAIVDSVSRARRLRLTLTNEGGGPASDVEAIITAPIGIVFVDPDSKESKERFKAFSIPRPKVRHPFESRYSGLAPPQLPPLDPLPSSVFVSAETPHKCHLDFGQVRHHRSVSLDFILLVPSHFQQAGGELDLSVTATNVREEIKRSIPFRVTVKEVEPVAVAARFAARPSLVPLLLAAYEAPAVRPRVTLIVSSSKLSDELNIRVDEVSEPRAPD